MLLGAVGFVLLIASVNVAKPASRTRGSTSPRKLPFAEHWDRIGEAARQFVTEGILLALWARASVSRYRLRECVASTDERGRHPARGMKLAWTGACSFSRRTSVITGVLFGLAPLGHSSSVGISESLKDTAGSTTAAAGAQSFAAFSWRPNWQWLWSAHRQRLMLRAFWKLRKFILACTPTMCSPCACRCRAERHGQRQIMDFWTRFEARLTNLPGVRSAALASGLRAPPAQMKNTDIEGFVLKGEVRFKTWISIRREQGLFYNLESADGWPAVRIARVRTSPEVPSSTRHGNDILAESKCPWGRVRPGGNKKPVHGYRIVDDVKNAGLDRPAARKFILPFRQPSGQGSSDMYVVMRAQGATRARWRASCASNSAKSIRLCRWRMCD